MRVILIDDEPIALKVLEIVLSEFQDVEIVGQYTEPLIALDEIVEVKPDVVFLDIEMGGINGLEAGELLLSKLPSLEIVYVTAYSQYAIDAFEINAIDYLLKPIQQKRLQKTIGKLQKKLALTVDQTEEHSHSKLKIKCFGSFQVFDSNDRLLSWRTKKVKELFAYLWLQNGKPADKAVIMEAIFYEKSLSQASTLLHTTVYQLRNSLKKMGYSNAILYLNESYILHVPSYSDIEELDCLLSTGRLTEVQAKRVLEIFQVEMLSEGYVWVADMQQRYRNAVFEALEAFVVSRLDMKKYTPTAKACLDQMYEIDPFGERAANLIIRYLGEQNNMIELNLFYKRYEDNLRAEMDMCPMEATRNLYTRYKSR